MYEKLFAEMGFHRSVHDDKGRNIFFIASLPGETVSAIHGYDERKQHWLILGVSHERLVQLKEKLLAIGLDDITDLADEYINHVTESS